MDIKLVDTLLKMKEWQNFECKRAKIAPAKLLETVCAFANNDGGLIVLGLEDPEKADEKKRLIGIQEHPDNISEILRLIDKEVEPQIRVWQKYEIDIINNDKKEDKLVVLLIKKSNDIHSLKKGDTFIRRGRQNVKINSSEIIRLKYERGSIKYEDELSNVDDIAILDEALFERFKKDINSNERDSWQILKDNGLAINNSKGWQFTNAGVLLFAKNPSVSLRSKCGIKISHYYGKRFQGLLSSKAEHANLVEKPFTIEAPLFKQIEKALEYFRIAVNKSATLLTGASFISNLLIPEWAFQEAVVNAVIHRNYSVQNDIQIRFYDDSIEIESPGSYPGHITPANIRFERFARNPIILRALNKFQSSPNLDIGEGVNRIFQAMKEHNLYDPIYMPSNIRPNSVLLILFNIQKIEQWDIVSNYIDKNHSITNFEARRITGISDTLKMNRVLTSWVEKGLLERKGAKRDSRYIKPSQKDISDLFSLSDENKNAKE